MYSGRSSVYFWHVELCFHHACLLWLWFLEMHLNIVCRFCMWKVSCLTFALTNADLFWTTALTYASVKQHMETFQKVIGVLSHWALTCQNTCLLPLFWLWKKDKPKVDIVLYSQYFSVYVIPKLPCLLLVVSTLPWKHLIGCCQCYSHFHFPPR